MSRLTFGQLVVLVVTTIAAVPNGYVLYRRLWLGEPGESSLWLTAAAFTTCTFAALLTTWSLGRHFAGPRDQSGGRDAV